MKIDSLYVNGFMGHVKRSIDVPETGIVLVLGPNGSGKSALIEAVAHCCWGEGLRGRCWSDDAKLLTDLRVLSGATHIRRTRKGPKSVLRFGDAEAVKDTENKYETAGKAQQALDAEIPDFEVWRRACVLSSSDAASFTGASDGDRKRLLERMLGIDRFDIAHKTARDDARGATRTTDSVGMRISSAERMGEERVARLETAQRELGAAGSGADPSGAKEALDAVRARLAATDSDLVGMAADVTSAQGDRAVAHDRLKRALARAEELGDECGECGQPIGEELQGRIREEIARRQKAFEAERTKHEAAAAEVEDTVEELQEERALFERRVSDLRVAWQQARDLASARDRWAAEVKTIEAAIEKDVDALAVLEAERVDAAKASGELDACVEVLGLGGIRASLLGDALEAINESANLWLSQLATPIRINLSTHSQTKAGKHSDKLGLEVTGVGARDYNGCSGGQRRRIDVALLFAISEVARAAWGQDDWTIWADEVFDALDPEGVEALAHALGDLSRDRALFVISHSETLVDALKPDKVFRFSGVGELADEAAGVLRHLDAQNP